MDIFCHAVTENFTSNPWIAGFWPVKASKSSVFFSCRQQDMYQLLRHKYVLLTLSCSIEEPISGILCEILLTFFVGQICCFSQIDILKVGRTRTLDFNLVEGPLKYCRKFITYPSLFQGGNTSSMGGQIWKCFVANYPKNWLFFDVCVNFFPPSIEKFPGMLYTARSRIFWRFWKSKFQFPQIKLRNYICF